MRGHHEPRTLQVPKNPSCLQPSQVSCRAEQAACTTQGLPRSPGLCQDKDSSLGRAPALCRNPKGAIGVLPAPAIHPPLVPIPRTKASLMGWRTQCFPEPPPLFSLRGLGAPHCGTPVLTLSSVHVSTWSGRTGSPSWDGQCWQGALHMNRSRALPEQSRAPVPT